jgi:hypothetical protein
LQQIREEQKAPYVSFGNAANDAEPALCIHCAYGRWSTGIQNEYGRIYAVQLPRNRDAAGKENDVPVRAYRALYERREVDYGDSIPIAR